MLYTSTRDNDVRITGSQAIVNGISKDGGLYIPSSFPKYSESDLEAFKDLSYVDLATKIMSDFLDFSKEEINGFCKAAYSRFETDAVCPVKKIDESTYILELFHGPTLAFKDVALTMLPHLLTASMKKNDVKEKVLILVATSGDTGKAALEGFKNVDGTNIVVLYPEDGVSEMQKLQMRTQEGDNVSVIGIDGNFDDAQAAVKRIFRDEKMIKSFKEKGFVLSSANSINWGRLLPQIVYYFYAYSKLLQKGDVNVGDKVNFSVPSGNFGDILAGYYAKKTGLPVGKLICASNVNRVLADFFETGVYDKNREFYKTISPSMDILVSSNLERFLYDVSGGDAKFVKEKMDDLNEKGKYDVPYEMIENAGIVGGYADENDTRMAIDCFFDSFDYPLDTHTAVAVTVYNNYVAKTGDETPTVVVSTASPYKFPKDVYDAITHENCEDAFSAIQKLHRISGVKIPDAISTLVTKKIRFDTVVGVNDVNDAVLNAF